MELDCCNIYCVRKWTLFISVFGPIMQQGVQPNTMADSGWKS